MNKYKRLFNRLSVMPFPEYFFRAKDLLISHGEYILRKTHPHSDTMNPGMFQPLPFLKELEKDFAQEILPEMEEYIQKLKQGIIHFHHKDYEIGDPVQWHRDPTSGATLPLMRGKKYHSLGVYSKADIVYLRFLNRHTYLLYLAIYVGITGKEADLLKKLLRSWMKENPYLEGLSWSDSWQVGARVINWSLILSFAWKELEKDPDFLQEMAQVHIQQASFVYRHPAKYSSANNHLLCEYIACSFAVLLYPDSNFAKEHGEHIFKDLEKEVQRQYYSDGFHREQSLAYQWFTLDYLLLFVHSASAMNISIPAEIPQMVEKGLGALSKIIPKNGQIPHLCDGGFENTHDMYYQFFPEINKYFSLLYRGALFFQRKEWIRTELPDERCRLLYGGHIPAFLNKKSSKESTKTLHLKDAGYYIFEQEAFRLLFDVGPFGLETTYAHAHADCLSILMDVNGKPFLIDSGTYDYHPKDRKWRNYFRGTASHNTIQIDQKDQAVSGGNMLWLSNPETTVTSFSEEGNLFMIEARHNGYERLSDPVIHLRKISCKQENYIEITDSIECRQQHEIEIFFHFAPEVEIQHEDSNRYICILKNQKVILELDEQLSSKLVIGDRKNYQGWYSTNPDTILPNPVIIGKMECSNCIRLNCSLQILNTGFGTLDKP